MASREEKIRRRNARKRFSSDFVLSLVPSNESAEVKGIRGNKVPNDLGEDDRLRWYVGNVLSKAVGVDNALHLQSVAKDTHGGFVEFAKEMGVNPQKPRQVSRLAKDLVAIIDELRKVYLEAKLKS